MALVFKKWGIMMTPDWGIMMALKAKKWGIYVALGNRRPRHVCSS